MLKLTALLEEMSDRRENQSNSQLGSYWRPGKRAQQGSVQGGYTLNARVNMHSRFGV